MLAGHGIILGALLYVVIGVSLYITLLVMIAFLADASRYRTLAGRAWSFPKQVTVSYHHAKAEEWLSYMMICIVLALESVLIGLLTGLVVFYGIAVAIQIGTAVAGGVSADHHAAEQRELTDKPST